MFLLLFSNFDRKEMLRDYFLRLRDLHQDRVQFQSERTRHCLANQASQQEDKYQAYIIEQMHDRNRIIAASAIANTLGNALRKQISIFFSLTLPNNTPLSSKTSLTSEGSRRSSNHREDSMSVSMVLVRLSVDSIVRVFQGANSRLKRQAFNYTFGYCRSKKIMEKAVNCLKRVHTRRVMHSLRAFTRDRREEEIFTDSFSMISRQDRARRERGVNDQSYLSFMLEKEHVNTECLSCRQSCQVVLLREREIARLGEQITRKNEQVGELRELLSQKTLQLKRREQECVRLRRKGQQLDQSGLSQSRNSSYFSEMERYVLGGKRIRKNGSRGSESSVGRGQEVGKELLGKYMRESFQLKESMDLVREMCVELEGSLPASGGRVIVQRMLRVLSLGEEPVVEQVDE